MSTCKSTTFLLGNKRWATENSSSRYLYYNTQRTTSTNKSQSSPACGQGRLMDRMLNFFLKFNSLTSLTFRL
jgi:hypothetical protein